MEPSNEYPEIETNLHIRRREPRETVRGVDLPYEMINADKSVAAESKHLRTVDSIRGVRRKVGGIPT